MEVAYSLTVEDLLAFLRNHKKQGPRSWSRFRPFASSFLWLIFLILMLAVIFGLKSQLALFLMALLSGGLFGSLAMLFALWWFGRIEIRSAEDLYTDEHSRWLFSPRRLTISPESITIIDVYEQTIICWAAVWRIIATDHYIFLYTTDTAAQIAPRRAFRDQQHFEEFLALARQYQQDRGRQAPKPTGIIAGLPPPSDAITRPGPP